MGKAEYVFRHQQAIGWLSMPLLIQHRTLCYVIPLYESKYLLNPSIQFRCHHTHNIRCSVYFVIIIWCRLALSKCRKNSWLYAFCFIIILCTCIVCCNFVYSSWHGRTDLPSARVQTKPNQIKLTMHSLE